MVIRPYSVFGLTAGGINFDPSAIDYLLINAGTGGNTGSAANTGAGNTGAGNSGH